MQIHTPEAFACRVMNCPVRSNSYGETTAFGDRRDETTTVSKACFNGLVILSLGSPMIRNSVPAKSQHCSKYQLIMFG